MKTLVQFGMLLALFASTGAFAGTGGHGADVVLCTRWDTWIGKHPQDAKKTSNHLDGYYSWDWMQLNRPPLLIVPGKDSEFYVDQVQDFLVRNFPSLASRFAAFRERAFTDTITADEQGIIRTWVDEIKQGDPPDGNLPLPANCSKNPTRVINRTPIGTEKNNVILYYYSRPIKDLLRKQNDPQYSMILLHEFLRDDRDNKDPAIWVANTTIHGTRREAQRTKDLKTLLLALGIETGDTPADLAAYAERTRIYQLFASQVKEVNQQIVLLNKAWKDIPLEDAQKKACELDELMKRSWTAYVARVQGAGPAAQDPILRALSSEIGFEAVLMAWPPLHDACTAPATNGLSGSGLPMVGPLGGFSPVLPGGTQLDVDQVKCAKDAQEVHDQIAAISIKDWDADVLREVSLSYFSYRMDCTPKAVDQGFFLGGPGVQQIQTMWGMPPMPPLSTAPPPMSGGSNP